MRHRRSYMSSADYGDLLRKKCELSAENDRLKARIAELEAELAETKGKPCGQCGGSGQIGNLTCPHCGGSGRTQTAE